MTRHHKVLPLRKCVLIASLVLVLGMAQVKAQSNPSTLESNNAILLRLSQYELIAETRFTTKVGVCIDELMGKRWLLTSNPAVQFREGVVDRLRQAAETCSVATSGESSRVVAQLRMKMEQLLALASQLESPHLMAQQCVTRSATSTDFESCITQTLGKTAAASTLREWSSIYERQRAK